LVSRRQLVRVHRVKVVKRGETNQQFIAREIESRSILTIVGFQTQMKWGEQARVLRLIPGLENAEFVRFGMIHRNTYINGPDVLRDTWQMKTRDDLFFAGQISGVEGYVESAASGLMAGRNAAALVLGRPTRVLPRTTALGALGHYVSHANPRHYQPTNITFGIMEPIDDRLSPRSYTLL
jgi:methylenetetrahydrofolate--tRNA-(uracil-5-)-methyltransferase